MSTTEEQTEIMLDEKKEEETKKEQPKSEVMQREPENKCCKVMKEDVHIAFKCCAYSWCVSLNGIECCCVSLSRCCIALSEVALCCNKMLESIDCDTH